MPPVFRTVTKKIFIIINMAVVALFLMGCANSWLEPGTWWMIALLGLAFPFLLFFTAAFFIFWIIFRSKWAFLSLTALILGYQDIRALVGIHFNEDKYAVQKQEGDIRVLTWNVLSFDEPNRNIKHPSTYRNNMFDFIKEQDPDVLCFQEYLEPNSKKYYSNVQDMVKMGYKYHFRVADYARKNNTFQNGVAIFSKHPIKDSGRVQYSGPQNLRAAESLIYADVEINGRMIRVYTTHLQSVLFQNKEFRSLEIIKNAEDSMLEASKSLVKKLRIGYMFRGDQADEVRKHADNSPYPEIICGDFNDVPNSYTYFKVRGDREDAFVKKGLGIGRTFRNISPTLRIDYIFADKQFEVVQFKRFVLPYSDHFPFITDLRLVE
jgi:endonuclease/exonuclease/phosphatase family metal-dependent hydrolase